MADNSLTTHDGREALWIAINSAIEAPDWEITSIVSMVLADLTAGGFAIIQRGPALTNWPKEICKDE